MLDYRSSAVLVKGDHMQISFKLAQIFEKLQRLQKISQDRKFLTIALALKDIVLGLNGPMESFPSIKLQSVAG